MHEIHSFLWDVRHDAAIRARYSAEPDAVLDEYRIHGPEREEVRRMDIHALYRRGVNPYLLYFCAIQMEIPRDAYYAAIRGEEIA